MMREYPASGPSHVDIGILISDGGREEDPVLDSYRKAAALEQARRLVARAASNGETLVLYTVGVGTPGVKERLWHINKEGKEYAPMLQDPSDPSSQMFSTLDETILQEVAATLGGSYVHFNDLEKVVDLVLGMAEKHRKLSHMEKSSSYTPLAPAFLGLSLLLLLYLLGCFQPILVLLSTVAHVVTFRPQPRNARG
jgi:hypothetical protein